jgi:hypothetical protein
MLSGLAFTVAMGFFLLGRLHEHDSKSEACERDS